MYGECVNGEECVNGVAGETRSGHEPPCRVCWSLIDGGERESSLERVVNSTFWDLFCYRCEDFQQYDWSIKLSTFMPISEADVIMSLIN